MCTSRNLEKCDVTLSREQNSWISTIFLDMKRLKRSTGYRVPEYNHAQESHTCQFCLFFPIFARPLLVEIKSHYGSCERFLLTFRNFATMATWRNDLFSIVFGRVITRWVIIKNLNQVSGVKEKSQSLGHSLFFFRFFLALRPDVLFDFMIWLSEREWKGWLNWTLFCKDFYFEML